MDQGGLAVVAPVASIEIETVAAPARRPVSRWLAYAFVLGQGIIASFVIGGLIHTFVATPFRISGISMEPNFADGQFILVDKLSSFVSQPKRGDVVVLKFPANPSKKLFIKRIVGLPGETVEVAHGGVAVNGVPLTEAFLPEGVSTEPDVTKVLGYQEYFVLGDNRPNSNDSRYWGPLPEEDVIGVARLSLSPKLWGWIAQPAF